MTTLAEVKLWGSRIGAVALGDNSRTATFQYDQRFSRSGIQVSPLVMPLSNQLYSFPELPGDSFHGLPGLLSDSLPDRFGNALTEILRVGTSAGGARAKAIIAWNPDANQARSGQINACDGFQYWLLKFDGVSNNKDRELDDPEGYGIIEFAYSEMAKSCGIEMSECRLFRENGRSHFMTKRFDRLPDGDKLHMQSLAALAHFDFNLPGAYSYEQVFQVMRRLDLPYRSIEQQFRRMVFNIVARNQDDHVKNIAFLMNREGDWALSPAFDVNYSYEPDGLWTANHQMTVNGKQDSFNLTDVKECARMAGMKQGQYRIILEQVQDVVSKWKDYADEAGVFTRQRDRIQKTLRLTKLL